MYIIDVALKNTPSMLSVQRKEAGEAEATYNMILEAIRTGNPAVVELTCDQQAGKKISVLISEISAVQIAEKTGGGVSGRTPGFFSLTE